ncbi:cyclic nucleotide-binding domain-containing protein [bacterium]|nr:cyclic nucleotide-binding domain-containing protein [bacterium]
MIRWLFPQVRAPEMARFGFFLLLSLLLNLAQTVGLVLSESLLLAHHGPAALPLSFFIAAVTTVLGSLLYALGVHRAKNDRYFIRLLAGLALLVLLAWSGLSRGIPGLYFALVSLFYLSQCILTNHYWTFTGDFFDTLASKRLFPLFVVGASLGGMLGALLVSASGPFLTAEQQLLFWPGFLILALLLLRLSRRMLRRWGPLELEEADETSISEMRNAANYLRQSRLGQQLVLSCASMILAAFLGQYLYSSIILAAYPDSEQLADFLSRLLGVTNGLEILVEMAVTPWLIRTLGVANANQVHSAMTCASFAAICISPSLYTAVILRATRESLENAVASPIRSLVYNALPARSRGRVRAFLEGLVTYAAMALAGVILWAVGSGARPASWMYLFGFSAAALYFVANWAVRSSYLRTMIDEVQAGRLDVEELSGGLAASELQRLTALWQNLCREASDSPDPAILRLAQTLASRTAWGALAEVAASENQVPVWLRRTCLQALAQPGWPRDWRLLQECAARPEAELRLAALRAVGDLKPGLVPSWLVACMQDPQSEVRALAASLLLGLPKGKEAAEANLCLLGMLADGDPPTVVAALRCTPLHLSQELVSRCDHPSSRVARAALLRLADFHGEEPERRRAWVTAGLQALDRREAPVRRAALQLLHSHQELIPNQPEVWQRISRHLEETSKASRDRCIAVLSGCPLDLGPILSTYLDSASGNTARAAVNCLSQSGRRESRERLTLMLRSQVYQLWVCTLVTLPECAPVQADYLRLCLDNACERSRKLIFEILAGIETPKVIRSVEKVLRFTNLRARADALEVLSNLGDREAAHLLVLLLESGELRDKMIDLPATLVRQAEWDAFCASQWVAYDPWLSQAVEWVRAEKTWQRAEEEKVERILVLRKVPLFAQMNLEQLAAIDQRLEEVEYLAGEVVFEEGQLGAELYILLDGSVKIVKARGSGQELLLTRLEGVNYFGEMAILDDEPRSASVVVERNSRLLVLKGEQLKDLVEQMPEMAFEIIKVLTARIRQADDRLNQMVKSKN